MPRRETQLVAWREMVSFAEALLAVFLVFVAAAAAVVVVVCFDPFGFEMQTAVEALSCPCP